MLKNYIFQILYIIVGPLLTLLYYRFNILNIELLFELNYLNNWNDTKIKLPVGGGKSLILSLIH